MALSSVINPEVITGKKKSNLLSAQNFISGGSSVGAGVLGSAANKIVNFQRAGVQPSPVDISSIVKSISTGVVSNFNNQAQTINNSVTNIISKSIGNFSKDYQDRIKKVDEAKPTGVLQKILGLYRDVIGFIQFFGKRKFVEGLRDNLKALQKSFTDSFEVAKLIRQVIIKIVKQLSNLPKASPSGGGGINLDIDVPGGGLKKTAPRGLGGRMRGMGRGKMLALGAGALGLGAAGAAATNALSGSDTIQPGSPAPEIPGNLLDGLTAVIDRFSKAIDSLVKGSSGKKSSGSSSGGGGGSAGNTEKPKETPGAGAPGAGAPGAGSVVSSAPGDEKLAAFVSSMEAGSPENAADAMQVMLNRSASGKYGKGLSGVLSGYDQFSPISAAIYGKSEDPDAAAKYGPIVAKLPGNTPQEKFKYLQSEASKPDGLNKLQQIFGGGSASVAATVLNDPKYLAASRKNVKNAQNFYGGPKKNASDIQFRPGGNNFYNFTGPVGTLGTQPTGTTSPLQAVQAQAAPGTQVAQAAQAAPGTQAQVAQRVSTVSQPVQQKPQINYLPIDMSGGGQQAQQPSGGGGISAPPPTPQSGPSVPFLSATNTDNFLVLYSRMVYNIVDG